LVTFLMKFERWQVWMWRGELTTSSKWKRQISG